MLVNYIFCVDKQEVTIKFTVWLDRHKVTIIILFVYTKHKREVTPTGCEEYDRVCRERAVLARQLQEAKMALADVKTSWSGQIASLETQVARLSRQAGEEGAERRIVEMEKKEMQDKLQSMAAELEKTKQNLINSEAKVRFKFYLIDISFLGLLTQKVSASV
ncbi:uncharacterized protein [Choristoneura fumiferana]|uniref:uncharacterized protein n=1 Tax=Choristoneura fumiferana TaxID=7141 RepID=UPI003D156BE9